MEDLDLAFAAGFFFAAGFLEEVLREADPLSPATLFFSASIRSMTLPPGPDAFPDTSWLTAPASRFSLIRALKASSIPT